MTTKNAWGKFVAGSAGLAVGAKRAAHNTKQEGKIEDARKVVAAMTAEIGKLTVRSMDRGVDVQAPVRERYEKILAARAEIAKLEKAKRRTKVECPHCHEKVQAGMKYCGACGSELA